MDVTCQNCNAQYKVDDAKIPAQGIKAKCPKCGHSFLLKKPDPAAAMGGGDDAIPIGGDSAPPPAPNPFAGFGAATGAPANDPFAGGFGGTPDLSGFGSAPAPAMPPFGGSSPSSDPFGGAFGNPPPAAGGAPAAGGDGLGSLFQAKTAFEIKRKSGEQIGPFDMFHIKQMIYEQQLDGTEQLLDAGGNWVSITSVDELGEIFRLTGAAPGAAAADGGWGNAAPSAPPAPSFPSPSAASAPEPAPAPAPRTPERTRPSGNGVSAPAPSPSPASTPSRARAKAAPIGSIDSPAAPIAIDSMGRKRGVGERLLIVVETMWSVTKKPAVRIALGVLGSIAVLGGTAFLTRHTWERWFGWDRKWEAEGLIAEGDRTLASGERGPLLAALKNYQDAGAKYPQADELARVAEVQAILWGRDASRLDLKASAEETVAKAKALVRSAEPYGLKRAEIRLALAARDAAGANAAVGAAASMPDAATDPLLPLLKGQVAMAAGDWDAATKAFTAAVNGPAAAQAHLGLALAKIRSSGDYAGAKEDIEAAVKAEPGNGVAVAVGDYVSIRTGGDAAAAKKSLLEIAGGADRFGDERSRAEYYLGLLAEESNQAGAALAHERAAVAADPSATDAIAAAKRLFTGQFPGRDTEKWIASISKVRGSKAMDQVLLGEQQYAQRNWKDANSSLLQALQRDPASARNQYDLGRLSEAVAEPAKAKPAYEAALKIDPEYVPAAVALARWNVANGKPEDARDAAQKALEADPSYPGAYQAAGAAALAAKDPAAAEKYLITATQLDPDDYSTWMDLGEAHRQAGRADEAIPALEKAASLKPDMAEPQVRLGAAWELKGDLKKAGSFYAAAAKIDPADATIATRAGVVLVKGGAFLDGRKRLEPVIKDHPELAEAQYFLGIAQEKTSDPERAIESYRAAIKFKYEQSELAHYALGILFAGNGANRDPEQARDHFHQALAIKPDYYQCHLELSKLAVQDNQYDDAIKELRAAESSLTGLKPADRAAVLEDVGVQEGQILRNEGKNKEAEKAFQKVLSLNSRSAPALFNIAELDKDNEPAKAKGLLLKAIAANKSFAPPYKTLGYMVKDDNPCLAEKYWKQFVALTPSDDDRKEIQQEIENAGCDR